MEITVLYQTAPSYVAQMEITLLHHPLLIYPTGWLPYYTTLANLLQVEITLLHHPTNLLQMVIILLHHPC